MTLRVPTSYRRNFAREDNLRKLATAGDATEITLRCLRCFAWAKQGQRCDNCRAAREAANKGRKR